MAQSYQKFQKQEVVKQVPVPEVVKPVVVESQVNYAEFASGIDIRYIEAFKIYSKVGHIMEDLRPRSVWESLYSGFLGYKTK